MTDDDGGGAGADTDATNDTGTETGADDFPNYSTEGGTSQASEGKKEKRTRRPNELGTGKTGGHGGAPWRVRANRVARSGSVLRQPTSMHPTGYR